MNILTISSAEPGWRIYHLRRSPPWVRDPLPVVCWALVEDELIPWGPVVRPLVIDESGCAIMQPDPRWDYRISKPGEGPEKWIEEAKWIVREERRQAKKEARRKEQQRKKKEAAAAAGEISERPRALSSYGKALGVLVRRAESHSHFEPAKAEALDVLAEFIALDCERGAGKSATADVVHNAYLELCGRYGVEPVPRVAVTNVLKDIGLRGEVKGRRYEVWHGIAVTPREMSAPDGEPDLEMKARRFVSHHVKASDWDVDVQCVVLSLRAWCRRHRVKPPQKTRAVEVLSKALRRTPRKKPGGELVWANARVTWPK